MICTRCSGEIVPGENYHRTKKGPHHFKCPKSAKLSERDIERTATQMIEIRVIGTPAPQGSKRFVGMKSGKGIMVESSKAVNPWRQDVKAAALEALFAPRVSTEPLSIKGPVAVEMVFTLPKPKSAPKARKTYPDRKPDLSKLARATEDALTEAGVWEDDARIVEYRRLAKVYPNEGIDALHIPGAIIRVFPVS